VTLTQVGALLDIFPSFSYGSLSKKNGREHGDVFFSTLPGSKTQKNLLATFAGGSQARNRYSFAANITKKDGFEQISAIFLETADNEAASPMSHYKRVSRKRRGSLIRLQRLNSGTRDATGGSLIRSKKGTHSRSLKRSSGNVETVVVWSNRLKLRPGAQPVRTHRPISNLMRRITNAFSRLRARMSSGMGNSI
jgi:hypothetical protein